MDIDNETLYYIVIQYGSGYKIKFRSNLSTLELQFPTAFKDTNSFTN